MNIYSLLALMITLAALFGWLNARYYQIPTTIAIMGGSLLISLILLTLGQFGFHEFEHYVASELAKINFNEFLLNGLLSFLLFAGALTIDIEHLRDCKWEIGVLASLSTIASTFIIAGLLYYLISFTAFQLPFIYCLLFGALISPTDPIAVLAIFKEVKAPTKLEVTVTGESLFNDGVGIVLFLTIYQIAFHHQTADWQQVLLLFSRQAIGGIVYGLLLGYFIYKLIKPLDDYKVEILLTIAITTGGYAASEFLGISGPLAMVAAGIFMGNRGRKLGMKASTREQLDNFWELIDEILNAVLFSLIGLELLVLDLSWKQLLLSIATIPLVLFARYLTVSIPISFFKLKKTYPPHYVNILVWGGLRGGLAVALALALPESPYRNLILSLTYSIVIFSVLVQGLSVKPLVQRSLTRS